MSSTVITLTYAPAPGTDGDVAGPEDLEKLVTVATELQQMDGVSPLYDAVTVRDGQIVFAVRFDPAPTIGAYNVARGLVSRAASEAATPGELVEVEVASSS